APHHPLFSTEGWQPAKPRRWSPALPEERHEASNARRATAHQMPGNANAEKPFRGKGVSTHHHPTSRCRTPLRELPSSTWRMRIETTNSKKSLILLSQHEAKILQMAFHTI
ncbi:unnamed protein product, partial [Anisakis simplex]|uniref:Integron gene cassette protein n=1 Tax=Anisakis simplex TaxID=6269 RepID=A0A0M3J2Y8_ANISI